MNAPFEIKTNMKHSLECYYVDFYWQLSSGNDPKNEQTQLLIPYLSNDLIFIQTGCLYVNGSPVREAFVSPVLLSHKEISLAPKTKVLGIRFNPVAFQIFSGICLAELQQAPNYLKYILSDSLFLDLISNIHEADSFEGSVKKLDHYLINYFGKIDKSANKTIFHCLNIILREPKVRVRELSLETGYSDRWLQKLFLHHVGVNPSEAIQIVRINRFINLLESHFCSDFTGASIIAGYSDQSHQIRELKKFTSLTTKSLRNQLSDFHKVMNGM